jgi:hypothetical protein
MKKKVTLITSILLILALAVTFVGCNKDKETTEPTTEASKVSTTEPTTFVVPEIKDEPTTEATTEATTEPTTKKPVYSSNSGSSSGSGNSNKGSNSNSSNSSGSKDWMDGEKLDDGSIVVATNPSGGGIYLSPTIGQGNGYVSDDSVYETDPDVQEALNNGVALGE